MASRASPGRTPVEQYLADVTRFHHVADVQEAMLAGTDATLIWALGSYLDDRSGGGPAELAAILAESRAAIRNLLLSEPLTLPLPSLPQGCREVGGLHPDDPRPASKSSGTRLPLFRSLLVPVTLTFLVVPPEQGKDLDNIALTALPIAHDVLRPHIAPHLLPPPTATGAWPERAEEALARLRSVNALSVRGLPGDRTATISAGPAGRDAAPRAGPSRPRELVGPRQPPTWQGDRPEPTSVSSSGLHVEEHLHRLAGQEFGPVTNVANWASWNWLRVLSQRRDPHILSRKYIGDISLP